MAKRPRKATKEYYAPSQGAMRRMQDALVKYDERVYAAERKWGVDRLPWLAPMQLRDRFYEQMDKLNAAIDKMQDVEHQADVTLRGVAALEQAAINAGYEPLKGEYVEAPMPDGSVMAIVPSNYEVSKVKQENPSMKVYSVNEVAVIVAEFQAKASAVDAVKEAFPGAVVEKIRTKTEVELNDEIPF